MRCDARRRGSHARSRAVHPHRAVRAFATDTWRVWAVHDDSHPESGLRVRRVPADGRPTTITPDTGSCLKWPNRMDHWQTISRLCREALSRDTSDRSAFLDDACVGAPELRRQIDALIGPGPGSDTPDWLVAGLRRLCSELNRDTDQSEDTTQGPTPDKSPTGILFKSPFSSLGDGALADLLAVDAFPRIRTRRILDPAGRSRRVPGAHSQRTRVRTRARCAAAIARRSANLVPATSSGR